MRSLLLIVNASVAILCLLFFSYTFAARQHIQQLAREFVVLKTQENALPAVKAVEMGLRSELSRRLVTEVQRNAIEAEIAEFHSQPTDYIQRIASSDVPIKPPVGLSPAAEKIHLWKERIRVHYNTVIDRLFGDLRIFAGTNVIAACIAFGCAWRSPAEPTWRLKLISGVLVVALAFGSSMYVDRLSFFTILFNRYIGWGYPVLLGGLFFQMLMQIDDFTKAATAPETANSSSPHRVGT